MNYYRLGVFSNILFWFSFVLIAYFLLAAYDLLDFRYTQREWWDEIYNISSGLLGGALISFLFYFLVVFIPEQKKRHIIKTNLRKMYANVKRDILYQVIFASQKGGRADLSADSETVERLLMVDGFKNAFMSGREGDEGFYAFRNYIGDDVPEYREIILNLEVLSKQIDFVLHNYPITDVKVFDFFKRLEVFLMRLTKIGPGYEEEKVLSNFIWEIFGGWDWVEGDRGYDIIEKMIEDI
ncbi:MAG: hypothetical protein H8E39_14770 [Alphaproteobacteria bacterium]|nr:hypothetical protein [Alphaproteobacteria bacterium]